MSVISKTGQYAKIAGSFLFRLVMPFLFGIILNWVFSLVFLFKAFGDITWWSSIPSLLLVLLFLAGFPFAYFWVARGHALKRGLELLYKGSKPVASKLVGGVVENVVMSSYSVSENPTLKAKGVNKAGSFVKGLNEKIPAPVKWVLTFLLSQVPLQGMLLEINDEVELKAENLEEIKPVVQEKVDTYVVDTLIGADLSLFWILFIVNIGGMVCAWIFV